ncbi:MAG: hypothetical protein ABI887_02240 [Burkholderiales bacterium]
MDKLRTTSKDAERRSGADRRHVDGNPPGKHERRRGLESRQPEVVELDMSNTDWIALTQDEPPFAPTE